jgi:hypothetical protein
MTLAQRIVEHVFSPDAPTDPDARVALVDDLLARAENPWKDAIIDALVVDCIYRKGHEDDPRGALQELITWDTKMALDPAVSKEARDLIERGRAETPTAPDEPWMDGIVRRAFETPTPDHAALARELETAWAYMNGVVQMMGDRPGPMQVRVAIELAQVALSRASQAARNDPGPCWICTKDIAVPVHVCRACATAAIRASQAAPAAPTTETRTLRPNRFDCHECGQGIPVDEDGCCRSCGGDAVEVRDGVPILSNAPSGKHT